MNSFPCAKCGELIWYTPGEMVKAIHAHLNTVHGSTGEIDLDMLGHMATGISSSHELPRVQSGIRRKPKKAMMIKVEEFLGYQRGPEQWE